MKMKSTQKQAVDRVRVLAQQLVAALDAIGADSEPAGPPAGPAVAPESAVAVERWVPLKAACQFMGGCSEQAAKSRVKTYGLGRHLPNGQWVVDLHRVSCLFANKPYDRIVDAESNHP